jgi:signal transduction histidine kinase
MIRRISTKWVLAVLWAVVVPFVGFSWFVDVKVSGALAGDVVRYYLVRMASDLAERLDEELEERSKDAEILAGVQLVSWLVEDVVDSNTEDGAVTFESMVQKLFNNMVESRAVYDYVIALSPDGRVVMTNSVDADGERLPGWLQEHWDGVAFADEPWFQDALTDGEAMLDFHRLELEGDEQRRDGWYIGFASRIEKWPPRPQAAGVLLTLMSWDTIQESLDAYGNRQVMAGNAAVVGEDIYESSYAWLWRNDADTIIGHPDRELYGERVTQIAGGDLQVLSDAAKTEVRGMYPDYEFLGVHKKAAFAHCRDVGQGGLGWVVGVGVDVDDIYAPVRELSNWLFTTSAVILGLAVLFTFYIAHRTTRPIRELEQHTRRVGQGDLSARLDVRSGDELGQLAASFNRMTEDLQQAQGQLVKAEKDAAWREMARQVAHEIKNPLTPISLSAGLLERSWQEKSPEFEAILGRTIPMIQRQVENMRQVARDFYAFAGEHKDPRSVPLGLLLEHVLDLNAAWAEECGVRLDTPKVDGVFVHADPDELQRALLNLVANAIDAMPDGGDLRISVDQLDDQVVLELRDTGKGFDPGIADKLFEPYFTTRTSGTGLGLAIVRRVIEDLGGSVELVNAQDGPGAIARLTLPTGP